MNSKQIVLLLGVVFLNSFLFAQDWADEEKEKGKEHPLFFGGVNIGGFFANNNTAAIYTGGSNVTSYGIDYIFSIPNYKTEFDNYFQFPYTVTELPQNPSYKAALDLGLHAGINIGGGSTIYIDINSSTLNFEQFFTVAIDDPNNQSPEPTYEQLPIIGKEKRLNFNLGTQLAFYNNKKSTAYWSIFGNFNSTKLQRNYIVVNGKEYEIIHSSPLLPNAEPGGIGFGGGSGLGFKYRVTERVLIDLTYNLYYTKTKMNDNIQGFGISNGITFRIIWN